MYKKSRDQYEDRGYHHLRILSSFHIKHLLRDLIDVGFQGIDLGRLYWIKEFNCSTAVCVADNDIRDIDCCWTGSRIKQSSVKGNSHFGSPAIFGIVRNHMGGGCGNGYTSAQGVRKIPKWLMGSYPSDIPEAFAIVNKRRLEYYQNKLLRNIAPRNLSSQF